jgi:hypothetical protein
MWPSVVSDCGHVGDAPTELIGAWRLASFEDRESELDEWQQPLGVGASGIIICDPSGTVSVHIHAPNALADDYPSYIGYFGTFSVHDVRRSGARITGTLELSLDGGHPSEVSTAMGPGHFRSTGTF